MRITFDPEFDRGAWPGALRAGPPRPAVAGEPWVGPLRLLGILETALGLGGLFPSPIERAAALSAIVRATEGFWSRSAEKDPIGVARSLLRWIDWLRFHGWEGQSFPADPKTARLRGLAALAASALPGLPDRLSAVSAALAKRRPEIESITSFEPIDRLLPLWRTIFSRLAAHGVKIGAADPAPPPGSPRPSSDLRNALLPSFVPSGDGSLTLFRPYGPLEAAEQLAAWLASSPDISGTVIIDPDVILDQAFGRFGLPATGAREAVADDPLLQILPLVLAMGWDPPDPHRALELLLIPDGPIPDRVSSRLRAALQQWPAVGSEDWNEALADAPASARPSRLSGIFRPDAPVHSPFPASALIDRTAIIKEWANARRFTLEDPDSDLGSRLAAVAAQCDLFSRLVGLSGLPAFTEPQILRLNLEIAGSSAAARRHPAQAGLHPLHSPGAMAGPARRVIWWDFTEDSAPSPTSFPLTLAELSALESRGVSVTPATEIAADQSRRWRRPLENASDRLILVCPLFGDDGAGRHPHPLWDEVRARLGKKASPALLQKTTLPPLSPSLPMRTDPVLAHPASKRSWTVPASAIVPVLPARHSPTSLQDLIGCPFKWTIEKVARLRPPEIAALDDTDRLIGNLTHRIIEEVLRAAPGSPRLAETQALNLFTERGPRLAAPLFLPGASVQLALARTATAASARALVAHLKKARLRVIGIESSLSGSVADFEFVGRADLIAGEPAVVIDLKWSGESYHRKHLESGTAIQLASYAYLVKKGDSFPPVAFFVLRDQRLIALRGGPFAGALAVDGPPLEDTWKALLATMTESLAALRSGRIDALGIPLDDETPPVKEDALEGGRIRLSPPCKFCSFGLLCGLDWEEGR